MTRLDAKVFAQTPFWGGTIAQPITNKEALFEFFSNFTVSKTYDPHAALISDFAWLAGVPSIIHNIAYTNGDVAWPPPAFAPLDAMLKTATTMRTDKISSFAAEIAAEAVLTDGHNNLLMTRTLTNNVDVTPDVLSGIFDLANSAAVDLVTVAGLIFTMTHQPLPYAIYSKSATTGGNVLGLDRFQDDFINVLFTLSWTLPTDNARVEARIQQLENDIVALEKQKGVYNEFIYLNYAAEWQNPIAGYGAANVAFLKSVSKKYDPSGLFQKAVPGGFKLGT